MSLRLLVPLSLLVLALPLPVSAHTPAAPVLTCQSYGGGVYHEYGPMLGGGMFLFPLTDGNLANCPKPTTIEAQVLEEGSWPCAVLRALPPPVCGELSTDIQWPVYEYDGELEYAGGGAVLFVNTGDGVTSGVVACYGWPAVGHHTGAVYALETAGYGPRFIVTADHATPGFEQTPDCGDNIVNPCSSAAPEPSTREFPLNVVIDAVNSAVYALNGPGGAACNPLDSFIRFASSPLGPSGGVVPFGPGADGIYTVFLENDYDALFLSTSGHVWTA